MNISTFRRTILSWYGKHGRKLPWRNTRNPYRIMVSEIMLQQTQVSRVLPKYKEFLRLFPTTTALANASDAKLLSVWSGLGYWRRARFLKEACIAIESVHGGKFPKTIPELLNLPGIGPYTAGAIACFAFGNTSAFIDTNIRRVYLHFFFAGKKDIADSEILPLAERAAKGQDPRHWHWALFDYGALVLKDKKINRKSRHYTKQSKFEGSFRSYRAKLMKKLLQEPGQRIPLHEAIDFLDDTLRADERDYSAKEIIDSLVKDNLVKQNTTSIFL